MITIFTLYNKKYSDYAGMWEFCIRTAYPNYRYIAEVGCMDKCSPYAVACERYITQPAYEGDVYTTDIDMMILKEVPDIGYFHNSEMALSGLCYSNTPRDNDEPEAFRRLTGMHYCNQEWYKKTITQRKEAKAQIECGIIGKERFDDEIMLKNICLNAGLGIPPKRPIIQRHHGIHMGTFRNYQQLGKQRLRSELEKRITPAKARAWNEITVTEGYQSILKSIKSEHIKAEFDILYSFCMSHAKQKG